MGFLTAYGTSKRIPNARFVSLFREQCRTCVNAARVRNRLKRLGQVA